MGRARAAAGAVLLLLPILRAENTIQIGSATGEPGERVSVPILGTNDAPVRQYAVFVRYDPTVLWFEQVCFDGSPAAEMPADLTWFQASPRPGSSGSP